MLLAAFHIVLVATLASATNLFIADYSGEITSVSLTEKNGNYSAMKTFTNSNCAPNPSWLTIDANRGLFFCLNEGLATGTNGSISSFTIDTDGSLTHVRNATTLPGPVSVSCSTFLVSTVYHGSALFRRLSSCKVKRPTIREQLHHTFLSKDAGDHSSLFNLVLTSFKLNGVIHGESAGQRGLVLAHYVGSAVSSWLLDGDGHFAYNQNFTYTLSHPGPEADRQDAPHQHEAILDPTGHYVLVPDLGADLVRIYSWDQESLKLHPLAPLHAAAGSGPRHAAFWKPYSVACENCTTYMYLVAELAGTVTGYAVTYLPNGGGLDFKKVYESPTTGVLRLDRRNAPAEIHVTPDNKYLTISNRNDSSFTLTEPDGSTLQSDSLSTFALQDDGSLVFHQLWPAGGSFPRHYSMDAPGTLVVVGLQNDQNVVILARDPTSGLIGEPVARIPVNGKVTCVVFDEEKGLGVLGG